MKESYGIPGLIAFQSAVSSVRESTVEEEGSVRLVIAGYAQDADDLRILLEAFGLLGIEHE